jgi:hypothetical protein
VGQQTRVIVRIRPGQEGAVADALRRSNGSLRYRHASISALTADIDAGDLDSLAGLDGVESVSYGEPSSVTKATTMKNTVIHDLRPRRKVIWD